MLSAARLHPNALRELRRSPDPSCSKMGGNGKGKGEDRKGRGREGKGKAEGMKRRDKKREYIKGDLPRISKGG